MDGSVPAGTTYSQFKGMAKGGVIEGAPELGIQKAELGSMSPAEYAQYSGASKQQISGLKLAEGVYGSADRIKELRASGISDADIISNAQKMQSMYVSQVGSGVDPVLVNQAMQQAGFGSVTLGSVPEGDNFETAFEKGDKGMIDATDALLTKQQSKSAEAELAEAKKLSAAAKKVIKGGVPKTGKTETPKVKKPATKVETLNLSLGTVGGVDVPDVSIPLGKTPAEIAKILKYDKALLKQFVLFNDEYGLSGEDLKKLKKIIESNETLASAG